MNKKGVVGWIVIGVVVGIVIAVAGVMVYQNFPDSDNGENSELYCEKNADCGCGSHIDTGDCFFGNINYVNPEKKLVCPDFCGGFTGNNVIQCVNNECTSVNIPDNLYCEVDSDCVVSWGCGGCGVSVTNQNYVVEPDCPDDGPTCVPPPFQPIANCLNNKCILPRSKEECEGVGGLWTVDGESSLWTCYFSS
ncbi:hypothetical protein CMI46_02160 [Candidatus Pacearchaeota archaeon]|nr:hypothetical protein [Candidatus Pacearchaeota archaeon]|tara:strand:- start:6310 stop:6888 length:579 start_codon:yes stop_codon:yes gene_type:complete